MRTGINYVSTDEVNRTVVARLAETCDIPLARSVREGPPPRGTSVVELHDLDHVPPPQRDALLGSLLAGAVRDPVAVHGYSLEEEQIARLRANGVIASRALTQDLIQGIGELANASARPIPLDGGTGEEQRERPIEATDLGASVRWLSSRAYTALNGRPGELTQLRQAIRGLQLRVEQLRSAQNLRFDELRRWLEQLRQLVECGSEARTPSRCGPRQAPVCRSSVSGPSGG
jgi:hypothetical protein